jgi:hypothetical protein
MFAMGSDDSEVSLNQGCEVHESGATSLRDSGAAGSSALGLAKGEVDLPPPCPFVKRDSNKFSSMPDILHDSVEDVVKKPLVCMDLETGPPSSAVVDVDKRKKWLSSKTMTQSMPNLSVADVRTFYNRGIGNAIAVKSQRRFSQSATEDPEFDSKLESLKD